MLTVVAHSQLPLHMVCVWQEKILTDLGVDIYLGDPFEMCRTRFLQGLPQELQPEVGRYVCMYVCMYVYYVSKGTYAYTYVCLCVDVCYRQ